MIKLNKRSFIRFISFFLFALIVLSGFIWKGIRERSSLSEKLADINRRTFSELLSDLEGLDVSLSKINLCTSQKQIALLSSDIRNKAASAVSHLSLLPLGSDTCQKTISYLNKVASYSYYLSSSEISKDVRVSISSLCDCSHEIVDSLSALSPYTYSADFFTEIPDSFSDLQPSSLFGSIQLLEEAFPETPTLIYDGPFSEHITQSSPLVNQEPLITRNAARELVASLFNVSVNQVQSSGDTSGIIPTFGFTLCGEHNQSIDISCHGGHVLSVTSDGDVYASVLSSDDAIEKGASFLNSIGYIGFSHSYSYSSGGVLYINYEASQNGVICYPDLIQVGVSLDSGDILYLNATGYLSNHRQRSLNVSVSEQEAVSSLPDQFSCRGVHLSVIPTDGKNELLCWELSCVSGDLRFLYYINASNGCEEKVLLLRESENGTLVN